MFLRSRTLKRIIISQLLLKGRQCQYSITIWLLCKILPLIIQGRCSGSLLRAEKTPINLETFCLHFKMIIGSKSRGRCQAWLDQGTGTKIFLILRTKCNLRTSNLLKAALFGKVSSLPGAKSTEGSSQQIKTK